MGKKGTEQVFVPESEQPYQVPGNWGWVRLENVSEIIMGQSPAGSDTTDDSSYMPLIGGAADMGIMYPLVKRYTKVSTKVSKSGDLILCIRATLGKPIFSDGEYCLGRGVAAIRPHTEPKEFYRYFFLNFEQYLYDNATGTTFAQVTSKALQKMPIPIPPLPEQQRIVARIESLFAKLDEAKEKAQAVVDGFELRKSAILHKAFTGKLTERWRREKGAGEKNWKKIFLEKVITLLSGQDFSPEKYDSLPVGVPYITGASNFEKNHVLINRWTQTPTVIAYVNDVLLVCKGSGFGKVVIADFPKAHIARQIMSLRPNEEIYNRFLYYFLQHQFEYIKGSGQGLIPGISRKVVLEMQIALPVIDEQKEVVSILDNLFEKEQRAKAAASSVLTQIDTMKKSILARAFRGELGTNDPMEESMAGEIGG